MVRYKRYGKKKRYGRSTRVIKMKFQSFMDLSTSDSSMQIITISAGGPEILRRLSPQFGAYKYYKIGNISVKLVPASTLPVDPTGLSYTSGDQLVDPRDQLTPGLMRITNGEDVFENISGLSDDMQHGIYNNMLLDPRWFKWMLQSGVKRHATPRYWQIGQLHQDKWPGMIENYPVWDQGGTYGTDPAITGTDHNIRFGQSLVHDSMASAYPVVGSSPYGFFQTGHRGVLGWLPTDGMQTVGGPDAVEQLPFIASPPEVEVMKIILPKAYKTKYYYRAFITETVYFKEPIVNFGIVGPSDKQYLPLDIFHTAPTYTPRSPGDSAIPVSGFPNDHITGGNYGDD